MRGVLQGRPVRAPTTQSCWTDSAYLAGQSAGTSSPISGLRGVRVGRESGARQRPRRHQRVTGRPSPSSRQKAKRPTSLPATSGSPSFRAVPREAFRRRPTGLALARYWPQASQVTPWGHTPCVPCGGWRGAAPPLTPRFSGPSPGPRPSASPPWPTVRPTRSWPDPPAANSVTTGEAVRIRPWASPWPTGWPGSPPEPYQARKPTLTAILGVLGVVWRNPRPQNRL